jgi:hypothetical protein
MIEGRSFFAVQKEPHPYQYHSRLAHEIFMIHKEVAKRGVMLEEWNMPREVNIGGQEETPR